jgi:hypothetical protein
MSWRLTRRDGNGVAGYLLDHLCAHVVTPESKSPTVFWS